MNVNVQFLNNVVKKKMNNFIKIAKILIYAKLNFFLPKKEAILLYDNHGNDIASKLFKKKNLWYFLF